MKGLDMLGSFFDLLAGLCVPPMTGNFADVIILEICKYIPKFGLLWNKPGNSTSTTEPTCNVFGCQCHLFALDAARKFFWFGLWVPPSIPGAVPYSWSGGGICISLRVNSAGNGIQAGTGAVKLETKLVDVIGNLMGPDKKEALKAATQVLTGIGVGFSVDRSLAVDLKGMPPLLVNARRRTSDVTAANSDAANTDQYTSDKEYYWACKYHSSWAFPTAVAADPYCSKLTAHVWMQVAIALPNVIKRPETKASSVSPDADKPFHISDLFSFALDVQFAFSADKPNTLVEDVTSVLSPILAFSLFLLLLKIEFSFMLLGSLTFTIALAKFSAGLFADWVIKLGALLIYFRKGGGGAAFYVTYSRGEAANDMGTIAGPLPNKQAAKDRATELYKNMGRDKVKDALSGGEEEVKGGVIPTGIQIQAYAILTGCTGTFPNSVCAMNRKNIGFGHKTAICTAGGGGWTVYIEKPLENPKDGKADSLVFCFSDLAEEEKMCINLGFLLWLLDVLLGMAKMIMAIGQAIGKAFEKIGEVIVYVAKAVGQAVVAGAQAVGTAVVAAGQAVVQAVDNCFQPYNNWIRRRHWCDSYPRRRNNYMNMYCWGKGSWRTCGKNTHGQTPFPGCRLWLHHPMCYNDYRRRRRTRRRRQRRRRRRHRRRRRRRHRRRRRRRRERRRWCTPTAGDGNDWIRRRHWCDKHRHRRRGNFWCWGPGAWRTCGRYGWAPRTGSCRKPGNFSPMCWNR